MRSRRRYPALAHFRSADAPSSSSLLRSAPASSKMRTTSSLPSSQEIMSGVRPSESVMSTSLPSDSSARKSAVTPCSAALRTVCRAMLILGTMEGMTTSLVGTRGSARPPRSASAELSREEHDAVERMSSREEQRLLLDVPPRSLLLAAGLAARELASLTSLTTMCMGLDVTPDAPRGR